VVDFKLVIDPDHSGVGDERSGIAGDEIVVDHVEIVLHLIVVSLAGCWPKFSV
jgi:hypothetical protein